MSAREGREGYDLLRRLGRRLGVGVGSRHEGPGGASRDPLKLGRINYVDRLTTLSSELGGPVIRVDNDGSGTALELRVGDPTAAPATKTVAPMKVDSRARVTNLNSDELDGLDSTRLMGTFSGRYVATNSVSSSAQLKSAYAQCPSSERAVDGQAYLDHNGGSGTNFAPLALQSVGPSVTTPGVP